MARRRLLILLLMLALICFSMYQNLQLRIQKIQGSRRAYMGLSESECRHLKSLILSPTMKKFEDSQFFMVINALQGCPWKANHTAHDLRRSQLVKCCNASHNLMMTQENAPVGHVIRYDASKTTRDVTADLYRLFPKTSPFAKPIRSCAVVGNGGILRNHSCGADIDKADFVFRFNLPPLNWTKDVGTKTHLVTANPSILFDKHKGLNEERKPFIKKVKTYGSAFILLPAFSFSINTDVSLRVHHCLDDFDLSSKAVFFNPKYLQDLTAYWKGIGLKFGRMSSGLMLVSAAIEVCQEVTLYGFWPFSQDLEGTPIIHHYYDNIGPKVGFHSMPDEFYQYLLMHSQGILQLKLGQCE